nr:hypothetical protein [Tanacetum cinerariifolium]
MASEHSSSEPTLYEMTPATISSGLVPNHPPSTPFVPPSRTGFVEECEPVDTAGTGATTLAFRAMTSGAGLSTLGGGVSNSSISG